MEYVDGVTLYEKIHREKTPLRKLLKYLVQTADEDRLRRFIQEAEAAAALNHPNIAHIYEIGESNGALYCDGVC